MSKFDEKMSEMFNIEPMEKTEVVLPEKDEKQKISESLDKDLMNDYDVTRENLKSIVDKGVLAIDDILTIARESEHPRAFEVAATMIKNVAEANEKLINLQKQMKELTGTLKNQSQNLNVGKAAIFVGSTAELSKLVKNEMRIIDNGED